MGIGSSSTNNAAASEQQQQNSINGTIAQINSLRDEADAHTRRLRHLVYSAGLGPWAVGAAQSGDLKAWQLEPTDIEFPVTFRV